MSWVRLFHNLTLLINFFNWARGQIAKPSGAEPAQNWSRVDLSKALVEASSTTNVQIADSTANGSVFPNCPPRVNLLLAYHFSPNLTIVLYFIYLLSFLFLFLCFPLLTLTGNNTRNLYLFIGTPLPVSFLVREAKELWVLEREKKGY